MLRIENRAGIPESNTSGVDTLKYCFNKEHYLSYPKDISYRYNSRGFRDAEWPEDLSDVIWCVGDSFTVGIGQPVEETWPQLLQNKTGKRCLNLGEDACSNDSMALRIQEICRSYNPKIIVIMWSYLSRRRHHNKNVHHDKNSFGAIKDVANFIKNYKIVNQVRASVINLMIPNTTKCPDFLKKTVKQNSELITFEQLDYARDYHHFDVKTSRVVSDLIGARIKKFDNPSEYPI